MTNDSKPNERHLSLSDTPTLLLDADDTLWENNIYFEQAIAAFISFLDHATHTPEQVRHHLNSVEQATIAARGYGSESFRFSLRRCFEDLSACVLTEQQSASIDRFVAIIVDADVELLPGVATALQALHAKHRLFLVTKGNELEQRAKLERSGLSSLFDGVEVLMEKTTDAYRDLTRHHGWDPQSTWMIGNSPKSDINPALAAGLNAVFIPHGDTWVLEKEPLSVPDRGQRLLTLAHLDQLPHHLQEARRDETPRPEDDGR